MLRPTSCGPGPPLPPPPPPPPPTLSTAGGRVNNKRSRLAGKCVETVAQKQLKSIVVVAESVAESKAKIARTTSSRVEAPAERLAANTATERTEGLQSAKADDDFCIPTTTTVLDCPTTNSTKAYTTVIAESAKQNKNNNNWSIFKLPMLLATAWAATTTTLTAAVAKTDFERKCVAKQVKNETVMETATVGVVNTTTEAAAKTTKTDANANSECSTTMATTAPSIKWLLMWLMLFGVMAQAPQHQVAAEKSKH